MTLKVFLQQLLDMQLTWNELSVLLELGYKEFTRDDLLSNSDRCSPNTYSASALTRTLKKLSAKKPVIISACIKSNKITYSLVEGLVSYAGYKDILLHIARSKVLSLNTMRVALQMILNDNHPSTARFLADQLALDPDYLAGTVLPRMIVVGLIKTDSIKTENPEEIINLTEQDESIASLHAVFLDLTWKGSSEITLL